MPVSGPVATTPANTLQLKIGGMSCSFCANSISSALLRDKGVREAHVSLAHEEVLIRFAPEQTDEGRIKRTLTDLGFTIRDPRKVSAFEEQKRAIRQEAADLAMAAAAALVLFAAMAAMWLGLWQMRDLLRRIDTARDASVIAACVSDMQGPASLCTAITSRQSIGAKQKVQLLRNLSPCLQSVVCFLHLRFPAPCLHCSQRPCPGPGHHCPSTCLGHLIAECK